MQMKMNVTNIRTSSYAVLFLCLLGMSLTRGRAQVIVDQPMPNLSHITIDASHSVREIPKTIFGTFLEPIGNSTYNGLWAETLENPSFEAGLWSAGNVSKMARDRPGLIRASALGLPLPWQPLDQAEGNRYELRYGDAANSSRSLEIIGIPGRPTGIKQRIYLPVQRELTYHGSFYAKHLAGSSEISISLRKHSQPEQILVQATVQASEENWTQHNFTLTLQKDAVAPLEPVDLVIALNGNERVLLDEVSLMPDDALDGLDPDMVAMVRAMHTPLVRFGGNFTSGYHWRDGIGPRNKRVSMPNIAWGIPEYNTFGTDEFLHFCKLIGAQPQVALNLGSGTPQEAGAWVRYINEHWNQNRGGLLWELGNELWGTWNTGWPTLDQLAPRTLAYSKVVRSVDGKALLIATGQDPDNYKQWNAQQLSNPPGTENYLSTHFVVTTDHVQLQHPSEDFLFYCALAMPVELERNLKAMQSQIGATPHRGKIHIAFTEWLWVSNPASHAARWDNVEGALTTASMYNMFLRNTNIVPISDMTGVIEFAGIWKKRGRVFGTPASYVFSMYAGAHADELLSASVESGSYTIHQGITRLPEISSAPYLDVTSTTSRDGRMINIFVVNRNKNHKAMATISLHGKKVLSRGEATTLQNADLFEVNDESHPTSVIPTTISFKAGSDFKYDFPPASVTRLHLTIAP